MDHHEIIAQSGIVVESLHKSIPTGVWGAVMRKIIGREWGRYFMGRAIAFAIGSLSAFVVSATLVTAAAAAQLSAVYPCRDVEVSPGVGDPNPTVRDPVMIFENTDPKGADVFAEACFIVGGNAQNAPNGLWLDWNLALLQPSTGLTDVFGTVARIGPVTGDQPKPITQSLVAKWQLGRDQPQASPDLLLAQVAVEPCHDLTQDCGHSAGEAVFVTTLLRPQEARRIANSTSKESTPGPHSERSEGCLAPVNPEHDPELRQLTVVVRGSSYAVFGCLVSDQFRSFSIASMSVELLKPDGSDAAQRPDGNTRMHIGPLLGGTPKMPKAITLFGTEIPAADPTTLPIAFVAAANVKLTFEGCSDVSWSHCSPRVTVPPYKQSVRFEHSGP